MKDTTTPATKTGAKAATKAGSKAPFTPVLKVDPRAGTKGKKLNKAWLHEHINDPYVKQAQRDGYRARAAYNQETVSSIWAARRAPGASMCAESCHPPERPRER
jgi:hypothetical protein